jgi:hypothetical protein
VTPTVGSQEGQNNERKTTIMRTKLVKSIMVPLLLASALATLVAAERAPRAGTQGGRLEGTWDMQITLTDCSGHTIRSFASLVVFMAGGTLDRGERRDSSGSGKQEEKVFGAIPLTIPMRFASKTSRSMLRTSLRAG